MLSCTILTLISASLVYGNHTHTFTWKVCPQILLKVITTELKWREDVGWGYEMEGPVQETACLCGSQSCASWGCCVGDIVLWRMIGGIWGDPSCERERELELCQSDFGGTLWRGGDYSCVRMDSRLELWKRALSEWARVKYLVSSPIAMPTPGSMGSLIPEQHIVRSVALLSLCRMVALGNAAQFVPVKHSLLMTS